MSRVPRKTKDGRPSRVYRVTFLAQGSVYEVYARHVSQGGLFGFLEVEELLFQERSQVVIDPSEDRLKHEFEGVRRFYVPIHSVVRVDEVEREGPGRIRAADGDAKLATFPMIVPAPRAKP
jgi:hypothetical protein